MNDQNMYENYVYLMQDVMGADKVPAAVTADNWEELLKTPLDHLSETMDPKYTKALRLRYGLDTGESISYAKIAEKIECSPSTARRRVNDALRRLRHPSRNKYIRMLYHDATVDELCKEAKEVRKMYNRHVKDRAQGV